MRVKINETVCPIIPGDVTHGFDVPIFRMITEAETRFENGSSQCVGERNNCDDWTPLCCNFQKLWESILF